MTLQPLVFGVSRPIPGPRVAAVIALALSLPIAGEADAQVAGEVRNRAPAQRPPSSIHPETSSAAEALLKTAASHVRQGQWESAVELYQRAISQFPEALTSAGLADGPDGVGPGRGFDVFVNVSEYAQRRLASLPAEALAPYRARVDVEARLLFEQGQDRLDPEPLRRVVRSYFCSTWGDDAAELLADLCFQDGAFDEAAALYRRLVSGADPEAAGTVYPDPDVDVARVAAKALLCAEAAGRPAGADAIRRFAEAYPDAEGELAGRRGRYAELVASAIAQDGLRPSEARDARWSTFAGSPSRSLAIPVPVDPGELIWSIPLRGTFDPVSNLNASPPPRAFDAFGLPQDDSPAYFPVLEGDELFLTDGRTIQSYALEGGPEGVATSPAWHPELAPGAPAAARATFGVDRHTLTIHDGRIYARLGPSGAEYQMRNTVSAPATTIVALDRSRSDAPIWSRTADEVVAGPGAGANGLLAGQVAFGGAPLADDFGVYVTLVKPGTQTLTWVACLDPESGYARWIRYVCSGSTALFDRMPGRVNRGLILNPELGHRLLSLDGSTLYYQTDLGALGSIDARSGRLNWLATYPRASKAPGPSPEAVNHNPAVVSGDRVVVSPEDSDRIFAFDRETGRLAWQANPGGRVAHLLGVADGRVVATGNHVWTFDLETGGLVSRWPEGQAIEEGYGRGLLAGGEIYWPTKDLLYVLDLRTGRPADRPPIPLRDAFGCGGGNLAAGDGYLVIAGRDSLHVFCKPSRMLRYYQERIEEEPEEPSHHYRLARTAEALGDDAMALESLDRASALAGPTDRIDGRRLAEAARAVRHKILMKRGARLLAAGNPEAAAADFERAASASDDAQGRLSASIAQADATEAAGDPVAAVNLLQGLLGTPECREVELPADDRRSLRAAILVVDRIRSLIREHGRAVYARYDAEAEALLRRGREADDPRLLDEVVRSFPASAAAPEALAAIGTIEEGRGAWPEAASAYHELVVAATDDRHRALGLLGLARAYEAVGLGVEAREARSLASSRYGGLDLGPDEGPVAGPGDGPGGDGAALIVRTGRRQWPNGFEPLALDAGPDGPTSVRDAPTLLIGGTDLIGFGPDEGEPPWEVALPRRPDWSCLAGGRLVLGFPDRIVGLDMKGGDRLWELLDEDAGPGFGRPADDAAGAAGDPPLGDFGPFRLHGDRLYFLRGDRELVCLDSATGRPLWTYRATSGGIDPHLGIGLARVVLQLRSPNAIAVLDARDGRTLGQFPQDDAVGPWRRDPFPVAFGRVALVPDGSSVELFDLEAGRPIWEARESSPLPTSPRPSNGDPLVLGDAERLLVLRGETLQRLDPGDGEVLWSAPIGRIRPDRQGEAIALGHEALFWVGGVGSDLVAGAVSLADGSSAWSGPLPGDLNESWGVGLTPRCVVAYRLDDGTPGPGPGVPVVLNLLRRDTGARVQRVVLQAGGPGRAVRFEPAGIRVTDASGAWRLAGLDAAAAPGDDGR